jgi:hypothetical protein
LGATRSLATRSETSRAKELGSYLKPACSKLGWKTDVARERELEESFMQKAVVFHTVARLRSDFVTDDTEYSFRFYVVDSSLVGEPEEVASASHHKIKVGIAYELLINWRLSEASEEDLIKVLFHYGRRYVEERVRNGTLRNHEELRLSMKDHPERYCPLDLSRIPNPVGFVLKTEVDDTSGESLGSQLDTSVEHPNIRVLIDRMDDAAARDDRAGVLHASASVFETMAKDVVDIQTVQDQTLKSFFERYRKDSTLPDAILDYILAVYEARNVTPLAGHGSTQMPNLSREEAITLAEMTKAFVRIEYRLRAKQ